MALYRQSPQSKLSSDRTWRSSHGISFSSSEHKTWNPSQGLQFSSSEPSSCTFPTQHSADGKRQSSADNQRPTLSAQDQSWLFRAQTSSRMSNAEPTLYEDKSCSAQIPALVYNKATSVRNSESQPSGGDGVTDTSTGVKIFRSPLGFHIPKEKLQTALNAVQLSAASYWQYKLYEGPGGEKDKVKVHYCKNKEDTERVAQLFLGEKIVGFDIEWKINALKSDGIRKNTAIIQVACERRVALFHLALYPSSASTPDDFIPPSLWQLMESPDIIKVGVSIKGDCTRLRTHLEIRARGLFELSHLYKLVKYSTGDVKSINKMLVSLAEQVQEHLQLPLWKGEVRSSDWSQDLNHQQIQYAASDSYAGFQLFHALEAKRKALDPTPPRPAHAELNLPIRLADGHTAETFDEVAEIIEDSSEDRGSYSDVSVVELGHELENVVISNPEHASTPSAAARTLPTRPPVARPSSEKSTGPPQSPELSLANAWVDQHVLNRAPISSTSKTIVRPAELRAYAMWHEQSLDVPTIANLLRSPPLQTSTVANYIGKAVQFDRLPYKWERIHDLEQQSGTYRVPGLNWKKLSQDGERYEKEKRTANEEPENG